MRKQLIKTVSDLLDQDEKIVLLLGDIGVHGFREAFKKYPKRVYNIGICEQATVSLAAGLAAEGMTPIFHTIAPFMVERAFEQLKVDFGYQGLRGIFISVGASYDYSTLGCTHHCPGDVALLQTIPNMRIFTPGHPDEFDYYLRMVSSASHPSYFRLSEESNKEMHISGSTWKWGDRALIIAIGPMFDKVVEACKGLDVQITYHSILNPMMDYLERPGMPTIIVEPFYENTTILPVPRLPQARVSEQLLHAREGAVIIVERHMKNSVYHIGIPREFLTQYGTRQELDEACHLTPELIRRRIKQCLD